LSMTTGMNTPHYSLARLLEQPRGEFPGPCARSATRGTGRELDAYVLYVGLFQRIVGSFHTLVDHGLGRPVAQP
jgi:hypothetical protein